MKPSIKHLFLEELRRETIPQTSGCEYVCFGGLLGMDAYGLLCQLHATSELPAYENVVMEIPSRPGEYFYTNRNAMMTWSGLTLAELDDLIVLNDSDGLTFAELADVIDEEWA